MAEVTTPDTGVAQEPPDLMAQIGTFLDKRQDILDEPKSEPKPEVPKVAEPTPQPPESQATDELTPDDIPDEVVPVQLNGDEFEIVHNGAQHKLSRAETINLAQQGFDYTQKTQALAAKEKTVNEHLQRAQAIEQIQPYLAQDLAQVTAIGAQLQPYQNVDWVAIATNDPLEYPKYRAQYDALVASYNAAHNQYQQKRTAVDQARSQLTAQQLQQEQTRLSEFVPAWKDPAKLDAAKTEMANYLQANGANVSEVSAKYLDNAFAVKTLWQSLQYEKLLKGKSDKVKQLRTAPPVTRPGAAQGSSGTPEKTQQLRQKLVKTGDVRDAAALLLTKM